MHEIQKRLHRFVQVKTWLMLFIAPLVGVTIKLTESTRVNLTFVPLLITLLLLSSILISDYIYNALVRIVYYILNLKLTQLFVLRFLIIERDARSTHLNAFSAGFCVLFYPFWLILMTEYELVGFCLFYLLLLYYNIRRLAVNKNQLAACTSVNWNTIADHINTTLSNSLIPSQSDLNIKNTLSNYYLSKVQLPFLLSKKRLYTTSVRAVTKSITKTGVEIAQQASETLTEAPVSTNPTGLIGGVIAGVSLVYAASVSSADREADRKAAQQQHDETIAQTKASQEASQKQHEERLKFDYEQLEESKRQHDNTMSIQRDRAVSAISQNEVDSDKTDNLNQQVQELQGRVVELEGQLDELKSTHQKLISSTSDKTSSSDDDNEPSSELPTDVNESTSSINQSPDDVTDYVSSFINTSYMCICHICDFLF
jgi:hypothetical protein